MSPFLCFFSSQHSRIRRKFTKDGGRTRRWCRGALFQVSLETVCSTFDTWKFPTEYWFSCIHIQVGTYYILKITSGHLAIGNSFHFLILTRPLHPSHTDDAFSLIDWRQLTGPSTFSILLCICVSGQLFSQDCVFLLSWGAFDKACRWLCVGVCPCELMPVLMRTQSLRTDRTIRKNQTEDILLVLTSGSIEVNFKVKCVEENFLCAYRVIMRGEG